MTEAEQDAILLRKFYETHEPLAPGCPHTRRTLCRHIERDFVAWQCDDCGQVLNDVFPDDQLDAFLPPMDVYAAADASLHSTRRAMRRTPSTLSILARIVNR